MRGIGLGIGITLTGAVAGGGSVPVISLFRAIREGGIRLTRTGNTRIYRG